MYSPLKTSKCSAIHKSMNYLYYYRCIHFPVVLVPQCCFFPNLNQVAKSDVFIQFTSFDPCKMRICGTIICRLVQPVIVIIFPNY